MCLMQQEDDQDCSKPLARCVGGPGWKVWTRGWKGLITRRHRGAFRTCRPHSASHAIEKHTGFCPFPFACIPPGARCEEKTWADALKPATWSLQPSHGFFMADTARQQTVSLGHKMDVRIHWSRVKDGEICYSCEAQMGMEGSYSTPN